MAIPNTSFSFEMLGSEIDRFLTELGSHATEYLSAANATVGDVKTTIKNVVPRLTGDFAVDLMENETSFIITCELPGIEKENISIKLLNPTTVLIKTVESDLIPVESAEPAGEETAHLRELKTQSRQRTVILPGKAMTDGAKATFRNGIMELILPKITPEEGISIEIE